MHIWRRNGRGRRAFWRPILSVLLAACVCAGLFTGCLSGSSRRQPQPAPVVVTDAPSPEQAYWRNRYRQNRPVPPAEYQVAAKPPRNNRFGEFAESLYQGLDAQPALPALPADSRTAPRSAGYPLPPSDLSGFSAVPSGGGFAPAPIREAAVVGSAPARSAGVVAGGHFYPVEQLVYGGDYPDIDRPEHYRLMPKDVITVTVKDHPELSGQLEIQPDGTVRVPNAHDVVRLRGQSVEEAAETLRQTLQVYVRGACLVRVQANRARGGYYFVFGDVLQPGRFPMGMEPVKLSDALLAANWEANPSRRDVDGDELGPSFPAASPRGRYVAPPAADLARVMLITPHRSRPARTVHDLRSAMLGVTANDPVIRPGQIVVVPSLIAARNRGLGLDAGVPDLPAPSDGASSGLGFATGATPARLPEVAPVPVVRVPSADSWSVSAAEANMIGAFDENMNVSGATVRSGTPVYDSVAGEGRAVVSERMAYPEVPDGSGRRKTVRRGERGEPQPGGSGGWNKGF